MSKLTVSQVRVMLEIEKRECDINNYHTKQSINALLEKGYIQRVGDKSYELTKRALDYLGISTKEEEDESHWTLPIGDGEVLRLVLVPGGETTLLGRTSPFYISPLITQAQWLLLMSTDKKRLIKLSQRTYYDGFDTPVLNVNWHDAKAYCQKLSEKVDMKFRMVSFAEYRYIMNAGLSIPMNYSVINRMITPSKFSEWCECGFNRACLWNFETGCQWDLKNYSPSVGFIGFNVGFRVCIGVPDRT